MELAAVTVNSFKNPEGNLDVPLSNLAFYRWALLIADTNTHDTGLSNIVDWALKPATDDEVGISGLTTDGLFTFTVSDGPINANLFVWATK